MWVKMTESVMTGFGVYNANRSYDLPDNLAREYLSYGWCVIVEPKKGEPETAMMPRPTKPNEQTRHGRGRPITAR